ncbi:MAG: 3-deoxy-7-phosphoheptulonate synthase [Lentisphaeraceae bacterium]|nr:3-deoxy-7-phosphoheptulonate synthase [Lentisphaeraceae bacterium]
MSKLSNLNIASIKELDAPAVLKGLLPVTSAAEASISTGREAIARCMKGEDDRLMIITGPCSIHDYDLAIDYAKKLKSLQEVLPKFLLVMRVYFEKPRTTVGWKGLINDPYLNDTYEIEEGLKLGRKLLLEIAEIGLPTATEFLDPIVPQYLGDLVSWAAIGARTTESQTHREMASGLSMPVGFKNGTDGSITVALNAIESSRNKQNFLGISQEGRTSIVSTSGNPLGHLVLRGGGGKPNYDRECVADCVVKLNAADIPAVIVVDCSHANSYKDHTRQPAVLADVLAQISEGQKAIRGVMLESNIGAGNQSIPKDLKDLKYGVSVTDKCIDWEETTKILTEAHASF